MLSIVEVESPAEKWKLRRQYPIGETTWVVPDLKAKNELQRFFFASQLALQEKSILRATDLWNLLFVKNFPEIHLIDRAQTEIFLQNWVEEGDRAILKSQGSLQTLAEYIDQFLPVLQSEESHQLLMQWFEENPTENHRFRLWYLLSKKYWSLFIEQKVLDSQWAIGALMQADPETMSSENRYVFDLSNQLKTIESEVILRLAEVCDVDVIVAAPEWKARYWKTLHPYRILDGQVDSESLTEDGEEPAYRWSGSQKFLRLPTMMAEVKAAVSQVRRWLQEGVPLSEMAVLAPNIESYWPVLRRYLDKEGVPYQKDLVNRIHSHPDWMKWLAKMNLQVASFESADLETVEFKVATEPRCTHEQFRRWFNLMYDEKDINRVPAYRGLLKEALSADALMTRDEFIEWSLVNCPRELESDDILLKPIQNILSRCQKTAEFRIYDWLQLFKSYSIFEDVSEKSNMQGLHCANLSNGEYLQLKKKIVMGVCDEQMRSNSKTTLSAVDSDKLYRDIGFSLNTLSGDQMEMQLAWQALVDDCEVVVMAPETDFSGETLGPNAFWVQGAQVSETGGQLFTDNHTRWDDLQRLSLPEVAKSLGWSEKRGQDLFLRLQLDLQGSSSAEDRPQLDPQSLSLSATQLENYFKCPFIFATQKLFHLSDLPDIDMDTDRMSRGLLMHGLFEKLTERTSLSSVSELEIDELLEELYLQQKIILADRRMWRHLKKQYIELAKRFLAFEVEWQQNYPESRVCGREVAIDAFWDQESARFSKEKGICFRGFIDRIDRDQQGHLVIIDYKSSGGSTSNYKNWLEKGRFQLALYAQAVQQGMAEDYSGDVVGAFYFNAREMKRDKGYLLGDVAQGLVEPTKRAQYVMSSEEHEAFIDQINTTIVGLVDKIFAGDIDPNPKEVTQCKDCEWKRHCRAPHLK